MNSAERKERIITLRRQGMSYPAIGEAAGCSNQYAYSVVKAYLDDLAKNATEGAEEIRRIELERLDLLLSRWLPRAVGEPDNPKAAEIVMKTMDRRAKLLGLDAPEKLESVNIITVKDPPGWGEGDFNDDDRND